MFDLGRSFLDSVERRPTAIAVADGKLHKTYETWFNDIQSVARALEGFGLRKGDRLLVVMQNRWQMATLHWACQFSGIIVTPVNWRSTAQDLEFFIAIERKSAPLMSPVSAVVLASSLSERTAPEAI